MRMKVRKEGGKITITWRKDAPEDVEKARRFFVEITKQGWLATSCCTEFRRILEFKPEYEEILFMPLSEGG
jgi:hypothetical protein